MEIKRNFHLVIWYNTILKNSKVWVGNREFPLDSPGVLKLSGDGNLVVLDRMTIKLVIWSSNASVSASAMIATTAAPMESGILHLNIWSGHFVAELRTSLWHIIA